MDITLNITTSETSGARRKVWRQKQVDEGLTAVLCCDKHRAVARRRGRTKTARLTVNLDERAYLALRVLAGREDIPISQLARKAIVDFLAREEPSFGQSNLQLTWRAGPREPLR